MPEWLCKILRALIKALLRATTCERPQSHKEATIEKGSEKPAIYSWIPLCDTETLKEKKSLQFLYVTLQCSMCNGFGKNCDSWVLDTSTIRIKLPASHSIVVIMYLQMCSIKLSRFGEFACHDVCHELSTFFCVVSYFYCILNILIHKIMILSNNWLFCSTYSISLWLQFTYSIQ